MQTEPIVQHNRLRPRQRVRNIDDGKEGTVCPQQPYFPEDGPVTVAYDGFEASYIDVTDKFVIIGQEEPVADHIKCGRGENACIFAGVNADGIQCLRFTSFHWTLMYKRHEMRSKRVPVLPFPACQVSV